MSSVSVAAAAGVGAGEAGHGGGEAFVPADRSESGVAGVERGDVCGVQGGEFFDEVRRASTSRSGTVRRGRGSGREPLHPARAARPTRPARLRRSGGAS